MQEQLALVLFPVSKDFQPPIGPLFFLLKKVTYHVTLKLSQGIFDDGSGAALTRNNLNSFYFIPVAPNAAGIIFEIDYNTELNQDIIT